MPRRGSRPTWKGASPTGRMAERGRTPVRTLLLGLVLITACGGRAEEERPAPPPPDLAGMRIMLLPVRAPAPAQLDAELAFWLADRAPATDWVLPEELQRVADRTPAWRLQLETVHRPVTDMGRGDRRVRDPLYGVLRQLGAVVHADHALVPITVTESADTAGVELTLTLAVVEIRGGRVLWLHTIRGERNPSAAAAVASLAEQAARALAP